MREKALPSLEQLIRTKIQRRIVAAMAILFAGSVIITIVEAAFSYSDLISRLDRRADTLQDLIISEVLVSNNDATNHILSDANRETPDQLVKWITPEGSKLQSTPPGVVWHFPGNWTYVRPLKRLGDQDFGTLIFTGNFFTSGGLVNTLTHRLVFTIAICLVMAILLLPIARKTPKELILGPVQHLLSLIRDDSTKKLATIASFAEIKSIQNDFESLMRDRRKLESQRMETAQLRTVTSTAQMLAHDIRRPFSLLKATLDGLTQITTPEAMQELVGETVPGVRKSLEHLEGIISELTNIGSTTPSERKVVSISEAIRRGAAIAVPNEAAQNRISFDLKHQVSILGIPNQIERVIANIVANAIQAMGENDQVSILTYALKQSIVNITITNSGSSILDVDLQNIFQPFYTKGKSNGTGLGLAICRQIVTDHNGTIEATSTASDGTSFHISLPHL